MKKILVTGSGSGLGEFLLSKLNAEGLEAKQNALDLYADQHFDLIIHCAHSKKLPMDDDANYLERNISLLNQLLLLSFKKFIFISSIDVYPKNGDINVESQSIDEQQIESIYGVMKLKCEQLIQQTTINNAIFRCCAFLGNKYRENSFDKVYKNKENISLAGESTFSYILYDDIFNLINAVEQYNLSGIYNVSASSRVSLEYVKNKYNSSTKFGNFVYSTNDINTEKLYNDAHISPSSSEYNIERYVNSLVEKIN